MMKICYFIGLVVILNIFIISFVEPCQPKTTTIKPTTAKPTEPTLGPGYCGLAKNIGSCQDPCLWSHDFEECITKEELDMWGWIALVTSDPTGASVPIVVTTETGANVPTEMNNNNGASYPTGASMPSVVTEETGTTEPSKPIETIATIFANIPSDKPTTTFIPNTSSGSAVTTIPTVTSKPNSETPTTKLESVEPNRFPETKTTVNAGGPIEMTIFTFFPDTSNGASQRFSGYYGDAATASILRSDPIVEAKNESDQVIKMSRGNEIYSNP